MADLLGWQAGEAWARQKTGDGCLMCADVHLDVNPFSFKVVDFESSIVRFGVRGAVSVRVGR